VTRRTKVLLLSGTVLLGLLPWLALMPMGVWRGVAVVEPCDRNAEKQFGTEIAYAVRGAEYVRAFPPAWVCPLDNGESVSVSLLG
jgi:hypothetical protein